MIRSIDKRKTFALIPVGALILALGTAATCIAEPTRPHVGVFGTATESHSIKPQVIKDARGHSSNSAPQPPKQGRLRNNIPL